MRLSDRRDPSAAGAPESSHSSLLHAEAVSAQPTPPQLAGEVKPDRPEKCFGGGPTSQGAWRNGGFSSSRRARHPHLDQWGFTPPAEPMQLAQLAG